MNFCESFGFASARLAKVLYDRQIMTREEIERQMDHLARKYVETHDHKIIEELYRLSLEFEKVAQRAKRQGDDATNAAS
jgi:hypothetical protein